MSHHNKYTLHVHGMHCPSCVFLTESELSDHPKVTSAKSNLETRTVEICGNFAGMTLEEIAQQLSTVLSQHALATEPEKKKRNWKELLKAIPIALIFIGLFALLQKLDIVSSVNGSNLTYGTIVIIGIVASLSTCMAVVGGLVLSLSATFAHSGNKFKPQILFHLSRLITFFVLGGVIGAIGSVFQLSTTASLILNIVIAIVMLIMAINLLDLFHITKKFQLSMPKFLAGKAMKSVTEKEKSQSILTPIFTGAATFFLPCGFTQSMQIYTLSTGNFLQGGLTMLAFALGTLPILALISFTSFSIQKSPKAGIFFKTAGLIIIFFAIFNILNAFTAVGWIAPLWSASTTQQTSSASTTDNVEITDGKQIIEIVARGGYSPESTTAQAGTPTVITMITKGSFDCSTAVVIPEINYRANLPLSGETLIEIPPQEKGSVLEGFCAMGMYRFQIKFE